MNARCVLLYKRYIIIVKKLMFLVSVTILMDNFAAENL